MNLERTRHLLSEGFDHEAPIDCLLQVLESAIELLQLPGNDFCWSDWLNADEAVDEINMISETIRSGVLPERSGVSVIFCPTGPLQEVSLSSGWGEVFLKVAEKFDEAEKRVWKLS
jgi:hypothetical protein